MILLKYIVISFTSLKLSTFASSFESCEISALVTKVQSKDYISVRIDKVANTSNCFIYSEKNLDITVSQGINKIKVGGRITLKLTKYSGMGPTGLIESKSWEILPTRYLHD